jgi:hypothetical protein
VDAARVVPLVVRAGESSLHHAHLLHSSAPNRGRDRRIGVGISYIPRTCGTSVSVADARPRPSLRPSCARGPTLMRRRTRRTQRPAPCRVGDGPCTRAGPPGWRQTRAERQEHEGERSWSLAQTTLCTVRPRSPRCFRQFRAVDSTPQPRDWISTGALRSTRPRGGRRPTSCLGRGRAVGGGRSQGHRQPSPNPLCPLWNASRARAF